MQLLMLHPDVTEFASVDASVQPLSSSDAGSLGALLNAAFEEETWSAEKVRADLIEASDIAEVFGVIEDGKVVATASARVNQADFPGQGYVHMVASGVEARGRGLGRSVTAAVLARFAELGLTEAVLETDDWRIPALRTYLAMGFVPVIRDHSHYARWSTIFQKTYRRVSPATVATTEDAR